MRCVCAPDKFKGTLHAAEAAEAMAAGVREVIPEATVECCPVADGGEGTLLALREPLGLELRRRRVRGPLGEPVDARWGIRPDRSLAVVELAEAAGLTLLPASRRDPTRTSTWGVGELIAAALDAGCPEILVAVGGSATCDGGAGLAGRLGTRFHGPDGTVLHDALRGGDLTRIHSVDRGAVRDGARALLRVLADVSNPLLGPTGAAAVYAPQKGADPAQVEQLERGLEHLEAAATASGVDPDLARRDGAGAAGGAAYGLAAFHGARLERGIDRVLAAIDFASRCAAADLVLTGEGRLDAQSAAGKATCGVAAAAARAGTPVIAVVGSLDQSLVGSGATAPFTAVAAVEAQLGRDVAWGDAASALTRVTADAVRAWRGRTA